MEKSKCVRSVVPGSSCDCPFRKSFVAGEKGLDGTDHLTVRVLMLVFLSSPGMGIGVFYTVLYVNAKRTEEYSRNKTIHAGAPSGIMFSPI
jgi:hypothetical protein